jgi:hypothetical protein
VGAKTWMIVYADANARDALRARPQLNREATLALASALFPKDTLTPLDDGNLAYTCPPNKEICIGCFAGVSVVAAREFGIDRPSKLPRPFIDAGGRGTVTLHAMHSVVDWSAYAQWLNGRLMRALSVSPDSGILEDIGPRLPFEEPYWSGQHGAGEDEEAAADVLRFHPLDLGEAALATLFGYQLEGALDATLFDPERITLARYKRSRPFWKFW